MGRTSKRRIGGIAVSGLAVAGVVALSSLSASGAEPPEASGPIYAPYGTLTINLTDRDGTYELRDPLGTLIGSAETIVTNQPCATVEPGTGELLVLTANPTSATNEFDTVQVRNSAFGVNTGNTSCGSSSAAVISGLEQLKLELGTAIPDGVFVKSASLQLTQLKRGDLKWKVDEGELSSAISISQSPQEVSVEPSDLFSSITVESTSNKDNQGLSVFDGTSFELVELDPDFEVAVDCGEQVTEIGGDGEVADTVVYLRGQNESGEKFTECQDVGVIVEVLPADDFTDGLGGRVYWDNSFTGIDGTTPQAVQGTVTIDWAPVFTAGKTQEEIEEILDREIDYDGPGGVAGFSDTLWCASFTNESDFALPPYSGPGANENGTVATSDDTAPWCLVSDSRVLTNVVNPDTGQAEPAILQIEVLAGKGDPWRY